MSTAVSLFRPELGPCTISLRSYQEDAIRAIRDRFRAGDRSTLLVLPTGTGKTVVLASIARRTIENGRRVLVLAHRGELIDQAANTLDRFGIPCGIEKAQSYARSAFEPDCVVGTVQTMQRGRLATWPRDYFDLLVVDEAHHATAETYGNILGHFDRARVLGVTATPDRADGDNVGSVFASVAYEMSLFDAMTAPPPDGPFLCRLRVVQCDVSIDLRDIRTTAGDFNEADLRDRITPLIDTLANAVRQEIGDRRTIVFTPDVGSATAFSTALLSLGLRADWVAGDSPDRSFKIDRFREGDTQVICCCDLLTEGFDAPQTSAIVLCRPTGSRSKYAQMVGRGTRLAPGKADCLLVDFNYLTSRLDLVKPAELICPTDFDAEVVGIASELVKDDPTLDLAEAVERAEKVHRERQVIRVQAKARDLKYRRVSFDPVAVCDVLGMNFRPPTDATHRMATEKQVALLERRGVTNAKGMTMRQASRMIELLNRRRDQDRATLKQVSYLIREGIPPDQAREMSFAEASAELDRRWGKGRD